MESFKHIADGLRKAKIQTEEAGLKMVPTNELALEVDDTLQVMKVIEALEDLDDVQEIYSNLQLSEEAVEQYAAA